MRVLLDQNLPRGLQRMLAGVVNTAYQMGWANLGNGELLRAAENAGFNVLVTADQNLSHQQNLKGRRISIVVLSSNRWEAVRRSTDKIDLAIVEAAALPGTLMDVTIPEPGREG